MRAILIGLGALVLLPATAFARAPTREELPSIRGILERADAELEAARKAAELAKRDQKMEMLDAYEKGVVSPYDAKPVCDILADDKEEAKYRQRASIALRNRFKNLTANDPNLKKLKKQIGAWLINDLNDGDQEVRSWVAGVFQTLWPGQYDRFGFDPKERDHNKRSKAWRDWRKFVTSR